MILVVLTLTLIQISQSKVSLYLINLNTGKALTSGGSKVQFSEIDFGNPSQLWQFTSNGSLVVTKDDKYLGFNHNTKDIDLKTTGDVTWSWNDTSIRASDTNPVQILCIGPNAQQVVSCDKGANMTIQIFEEELYNMIKNIDNSINDTVKQLKQNLTSVEQETDKLYKKLNETQKNLDLWNKDLPDHIKDFNEHARDLSDNITLTKEHLKEAMGKVEGKMAELTASVQNITTELNSTNTNFTTLETALQAFRDTTNATLRGEMEGVRAELSTKSANGHITPDNLYEFAVLFLLSLGVVNVMDITRRLIIHSINQRSPAQYGNE